MILGHLNNMVASQLSIKSAQNINASSMLIENNLHASSVHCSYYGMFQFMTCKLSHAKSISFDTISKNANGPGSHNYVISEMMKCIRNNELSSTMDMLQQNVVKSNINTLNRLVKDLKVFRQQSDYHDIPIDKRQSSKSLELSKKIIKELKNYIP